MVDDLACNIPSAVVSTIAWHEKTRLLEWGLVVKISYVALKRHLDMCPFYYSLSILKRIVAVFFQVLKIYTNIPTGFKCFFFPLTALSFALCCSVTFQFGIPQEPEDINEGGRLLIMWQ